MQILHITFITLIYPKVGAGTGKLFVGVTGNDVTVNNKGGLHVTTLKNYLKLLHLSKFCHS